MAMTESLSLSQSIQLLAVVIASVGVVLGYVRFKSIVLGDPFTREQIMRERFENIKQERELESGVTIEFSEPRVRSWGFWRWLKSLLPRGSFPGYTHFGVRIKDPDYPDLMRLVADEDTAKDGYDESPTKEDLINHETLRDLGVFCVIKRSKPEMLDGGSVEFEPVRAYSVFVDSADPDDIGLVIESMGGVIDEIRDREEYEPSGFPKRKKEFEKFGCTR